MVQKRWHARIVEAIKGLAEEKRFKKRGFKNLTSYRVIIERKLEYKPDAIWVRKWGNKYDVVIWEVENSPISKSVAGDVALASLVNKSSTKLFNWPQEFGRELRKPFPIEVYYDKRMRREIPLGWFVFKGDEIKRLYLFFVFYYLRYYKRYVEVLEQEFRDVFYEIKVFECYKPSVQKVRKNLSRKVASILV